MQIDERHRLGDRSRAAAAQPVVAVPGGGKRLAPPGVAGIALTSATKAALKSMTRWRNPEKSRFQLVDDHRDAFEVKRYCEVLGLNRSSYHR
ncbi:hypothetical protein [Streptomyces sp. CA-106110]|uniref:hypothetical protein n=1 Tax=Streptomyces sp. CA-106110 TaxID=3240044 RepID=UPI003D8F1EEE